MRAHLRVPTHPGRILMTDYLVPLGITQVHLARHLGIPTQRVNEICRERRGVSPETAWLLAHALGTTPEFWVNLQSAHDLAAHRPARPVARIRRTD